MIQRLQISIMKVVKRRDKLHAIPPVIQESIISIADLFRIYQCPPDHEHL